MGNEREKKKKKENQASHGNNPITPLRAMEPTGHRKVPGKLQMGAEPGTKAGRQAVGAQGHGHGCRCSGHQDSRGEEAQTDT